MRIATWNVNSINQRDRKRGGVAANRARPTSFACRKPNVSTTDFPRAAFEALGYNVAVHGQKSLQRRRHPIKVPA